MEYDGLRKERKTLTRDYYSRRMFRPTLSCLTTWRNFNWHLTAFRLCYFWDTLRSFA